MSNTTKDRIAEHHMEYRNLGNTGLRVSALSLGAWVTYGGQVGNQVALECMQAAYDAGVNFFDNAEGYAGGEAETVMGDVIKTAGWRRSDLVISTKIFFGARGQNYGVNDRGLSRKHIIEGMNESLNRLKMDYVDVVFCHRPDPLTPLEETVRAMNYLLDHGKAFYWGTSEWTAQQITEAYSIARDLDMIPPQAEQPQYNMLHRTRFESEYSKLYSEPFGLGTTIWSPLASGLLTGKYTRDSIPAGSRLAEASCAWLKEGFKSGQGLNGLETTDPEQIYSIVDKLTPLAKELDASVAQLAIAWTLKNPNVSTVITGASRKEQVTENMKALPLSHKLTPEVMDRIEGILNNKPQAPRDWRSL